MDERAKAVDLAERVARVADGLGIRTVLIGAYALAVHGFIRATRDIDLAANVTVDELRALESALIDIGLTTELRTPDDEDPLGGVLEAWEQVDSDDMPMDPVEVVNFWNPYRPRRTPAPVAIKNRIPVPGKSELHYPTLADLVAVKMYADDLRDDLDVVAVLVANPDADLEEIRATCKSYGYDRIDALIERTHAERRR